MTITTATPKAEEWPGLYVKLKHQKEWRTCIASGVINFKKADGTDMPLFLLILNDGTWCSPSADGFRWRE